MEGSVWDGVSGLGDGFGAFGALGGKWTLGCAYVVCVRQPGELKIENLERDLF